MRAKIGLLARVEDEHELACTNLAGRTELWCSPKIKRKSRHRENVRRGNICIHLCHRMLAEQP